MTSTNELRKDLNRALRAVKADMKASYIRAVRAQETDTEED